jgi:hypothetical protein
VSFTSMHMETVYAADKNVTSLTFPGNRTTVPWIVLTPRMSTSRIGRSHTSLWPSRNPQESAKARQMQPPYRISPIPRYFAQRRVLSLHDCAHGDGLRRQECYEFRCSPHDGASSDASNVYHGLDEATTYTFYGWTVNTAGKELGGRQCNHRTEYPDSPDISLNDVSFTSMTVHMETVTRIRMLRV